MPILNNVEHVASTYHVQPGQLIICVVGRPAAQGSKRHVGGGRMIEQSKHVAPWREAVRAAANDRECRVESTGFAMPLVAGPLDVTITFTLAKPVSAPKRRRTYPDRSPDLDKLVRSTLDGLTMGGVWRDDAQVVELRARKVYPGEHYDALTVPGAVIRLSRIGDSE